MAEEMYQNNLKGENNGTQNEVLTFIWETIKIVVVSLAIIIPIRYYLVQPFFVKGASMEDNFDDGDYILVDELTYHFETPERGDVVIFRYPEDPRQFFIKRVIGLPGETVEIKNNQVKIYNSETPSGVILDEYYLAKRQETLGNLRIKLNDNEYYVLGDNRLQSSDSRIWGPVKRSMIVGKAFIRLWPAAKVEKIPEVRYTPAQ